MKQVLLFMLSTIVTLNSFSQTMNPQQHAVIDKEILNTEKLSSPPMLSYKSMVFSPDGKYLFMVNSDAEWEGKLVVYDVESKSVVKTFSMKKTNMYIYNGYVVVNPNNVNQLAVIVKKGEVRIINDWKTAPEDVLKQKAGEHSIAVKADIYFDGEMTFSKDGKRLYFIEYKKNELNVADLTTGKSTVQKLPNGRIPYIYNDFYSFIGNDEVVVFNESTKTSTANFEIYDLTTNQLVRRFDLDSKLSFAYPSKSSCGFPHITCFKGNENYLNFNLKTGEINKTYQSISQQIKEKNSQIIINQVGDIGFVGNYFFHKEQKKITGTSTITRTETAYGLFFFDPSGNQITVNFPDVNYKFPITPLQSYQISPNGKYMIFYHNDNEESSNCRLIIVKLY